MIEYIQYGSMGHKKTKVNEEKALKMINDGLKKGRYILIEDKNGKMLANSADAVDTTSSDKKKRGKKKSFKDKAKDVIKKGSKIKELQPIAGG